MKSEKSEKIKDFLKKLPSTTFVAIMGDCGKSTVATIIESICKKSEDSIGGLLFIDLEKENLFPDYLKEVKRDGVLLAIVKEEYIDLLVETRVMPNVMVVTYLKDAKKYIPLVKSFTYTNSLVGSDEAIDTIKIEAGFSVKGKMYRTGVGVLPRGAKLSDEPYHIRQNAALASRVAEIFEIPQAVVVSVISGFKGLTGRLEPVKKIKEVFYINDAFSQTFASLKVALSTESKNKNVVLILGGDGNGIEEKDDIHSVLGYCHTLITIPGSGTQKLYKIILKNENIVCIYANSIEDAVRRASERANKGDIVLFSPGFCPTMLCGSDRSERSLLFMEAVNNL